MSLESGHLMIQPGGPQKIPLNAASETTFFTVTPNLEIEFAKDERSVVTHLTVRQGGVEMKAVRK